MSGGGVRGIPDVGVRHLGSKFFCFQRIPFSNLPFSPIEEELKL